MWFLIALAFAEPPKPALDPAHSVRAAGLVVEDGPLTVHLDGGTLVPVLLDGARVAVAFSGSGTVSIRLQGDSATQLALGRTRILGEDPAALRAFVAGTEPLVTSVERGYFAGDAALVEAWLGGRDPAAAPDAATVRQLTPLVERILPLGDGWRDLEVVTGLPLGFVRPTSKGAPEDRRLSLSHASTRSGWELAAVGEALSGQDVYHLLAWGDAPPVNRAGAPLAVDAELRVRPTPAGGSVQLDGTARITSTGTDPVELWNYSGTHIEIAELTLDGAPVPMTTAIVRAAPGTPHEVTVRWTGQLNVTAPVAGGGLSTGLQSVLPFEAWAPWDAHVRVGVPDDSALTAVVSGATTSESVVDGVRWVEARSEVPSRGPAFVVGRYVSAAGAFEGVPAVRVSLFPEDRDGVEAMPEATARILAYYQGFLPALPYTEVDVVQSPDDAFRFVWQATQGVVVLQQMHTYGESSARSAMPNLEAYVLAHEVAHQWWGGGLVVPARARDRWWAESLAVVYACQYVAAAFGPKDCAVRQREWRKTWESAPRTVVAGLRTGTSGPTWGASAYEYGPYVLGVMLRARIGDDAFFGALDAFAARAPAVGPTTEVLRQAFEATSGRDLRAFFAYWIDGGFVPALTATVRGAVVTVTSDVPFGTLDVPLAVTDPAGTKTVWVDVVDGSGSVTLDAPPTKVRLDPDGLVLARARDVR